MNWGRVMIRKAIAGLLGVSPFLLMERENRETRSQIIKFSKQTKRGGEYSKAWGFPNHGGEDSNQGNTRARLWTPQLHVPSGTEAAPHWSRAAQKQEQGPSSGPSLATTTVIFSL